jgi:hypothetical protein
MRFSFALFRTHSIKRPCPRSAAGRKNGMDSALQTAAEIGLRLTGLLYLLAGLAGARRAAMSRILDQAIAALTLKKDPIAERLRLLWLAAVSVLIGAGGLALLLLLELAAAFFTIAALAQAFFVGIAAPRWFDKAEPPDPANRRKSWNSLLLFIALTGTILLAARAGLLRDWREVPAWLLAISVAAFVAIVGRLVWTMLRREPR